MRNQKGNGTIALIIVLAFVFAGMLTVPAMLESAGTLADRSRTRTPTGPCVHNGSSAKAFGLGYEATQVPNRPCNERAAVNTLYDVGLFASAAAQACSLGSNLTNFGTVHNCLNADTIPFADIERDVLAKQVSCGGPKVKRRKQRKYDRCMASR